MNRKAQLVIGPAGSGKSTYSTVISEHCTAMRRSVSVVNLDPAAEVFHYEVALDIRDLVSVEDAMEELQFGPNGGLMFCMEYLLENLDWLHEGLGDYEDDYVIFDCPGQIELYAHSPVMRRLVDALKSWGFTVGAVYLLDAQFVEQSEKLIAGALQCLSAMLLLEVPHLNILTKVDILKRRGLEDKLTAFLDMEVEHLEHEISPRLPPRFRRLNEAMCALIADYSLVSFTPLDVTDEDSINVVLNTVDHAIQWGEDNEPNDATYDALDPGFLEANA